MELVYRIALRLGKFPDEVLSQTSATGFLRWLALFEKEVNEQKPDHFYYAQLASEIACLPFLVWGKEPPKVLRDIKTWMLKFGDPEEIAKKAEAATLQRMEQDAAFSQSTWMSVLGIAAGPDGRPATTGKPPVPKPTTRTLPSHVRNAPGKPPSGPNAAVSGPHSVPGAQNRNLAAQAKLAVQKRKRIVIQGKEN